MPTSGECFEKDAVLVSELFGFVWTEGRLVKKKICGPKKCRNSCGRSLIIPTLTLL